jgi:hypothetical protein
MASAYLLHEAEWPGQQSSKVEHNLRQEVATEARALPPRIQNASRIHASATQVAGCEVLRNHVVDERLENAGDKFPQNKVIFELLQRSCRD